MLLDSLTKIVEKCWESKLPSSTFYFILIFLGVYRYLGHKTEDVNIESAIITDDNYILSGSIGGELWCWELISAKVVNKFVHTRGKVLNSLAIHPKKNIVLTASVGTIKIWGKPEDCVINNEDIK